MTISDLPDFVNRDGEIRAFVGLLDQVRQRIFLVHGLPRIGKSYLIYRLRDCCRERRMVSALVDFRSDRTLSRADRVMQRLRDQIGGAFAEQLGLAEAQILRDLGQVPAARLPGSAESDLSLLDASGRAGGGAWLSGEVRVGGDVVGRDKIVIKNSSIILNPGTGYSLADMEAETRRHRALRAALAALQAGQQVVLFFDHFEEATEDVATWLRHQILGLHLEGTGEYRNLWIVVAGCRVPLQDERDRWRPFLRYQFVGPLAEDAISLFWVDKRGLDPVPLPVITRVSGGNPWLLTVMANNFGNTMSAGEQLLA